MLVGALPQLFDIEAAYLRLKTWGVCDTPLIQLSQRGTLRIFLKLENLQPRARCYKVRGAFNVIAKLQQLNPAGLAELKQRGMVTASAGNFAIALGQVAHNLALPLTVLVPQGASTGKLKILKTLAPQAQVLQVSAEDWWQSISQERMVGGPAAPAGQAGVFISPAQNMAVMEGNATIGLEIHHAWAASAPTALHILAPYGGGGLSVGVACGVKQSRLREAGECRVFACEVSTGAPLSASLAAGEPVTVPHCPSFVDGIGAQRVLPENFSRAQRVLDGSFVVSPARIMASCRQMLTDYGLVVEGAGAASIAAAQHYYATAPRVPTDVVCIVSGGNIDVSRIR